MCRWPNEWVWPEASFRGRRTRHAHTSSLHEHREISKVPRRTDTSGSRPSREQKCKPRPEAFEKSGPSIVTKKHSNSVVTPEENVEERDGANGKAARRNARRT